MSGLLLKTLTLFQRAGTSRTTGHTRQPGVGMNNRRRPRYRGTPPAAKKTAVPSINGTDRNQYTRPARPNRNLDQPCCQNSPHGPKHHHAVTNGLHQHHSDPISTQTGPTGPKPDDLLSSAPDTHPEQAGVNQSRDIRQRPPHKADAERRRASKGIGVRITTSRLQPIVRVPQSRARPSAAANTAEMPTNDSNPTLTPVQSA